MKKRIIASFITAVCMAMIMSFVQAVCNVGLFSDAFMHVWLRAWKISTIVATPVSYFLPSRVAKWVDTHVS
ncbi:DUF2798 domain-containing protein [Chakrabartyella piscis]|uniref:DUF2798 domain-containing protein n=1 Tax=Chakrabartyella piscis TaxID=2918914 RepID=UPI0029586CEE|nr:DUF2798 domain-containing protein [Chakrabartyella piscis]